MDDWRFQEMLVDSTGTYDYDHKNTAPLNEDCTTNYLQLSNQTPRDLIFGYDLTDREGLFQPRRPCFVNPDTSSQSRSIFRSTSSLAGVHDTTSIVGTISPSQLRSLSTPTSSWTSGVPTPISANQSLEVSVEQEMEWQGYDDDRLESKTVECSAILPFKMPVSMPNRMDDRCVVVEMERAGHQDVVKVEMEQGKPSQELLGKLIKSRKTPTLTIRDKKTQKQSPPTPSKRIKSSCAPASPVKPMKISPITQKRVQQRPVTPMWSTPACPPSEGKGKKSSKNRTALSTPTATTIKASKQLFAISKDDPASPTAMQKPKTTASPSSLASPFRRPRVAIRTYTASPSPVSPADTTTDSDASLNEDAFIPDDVSEGESELVELGSDDDDDDEYTERVVPKKKEATIKKERVDGMSGVKVKGRDPVKRKCQNQTAASRHRMKKRALDNVYTTGLKKLFRLQYAILPREAAKMLMELKTQIREICPKVAESLGVQA